MVCIVRGYFVHHGRFVLQRVGEFLSARKQGGRMTYLARVIAVGVAAYIAFEALSGGYARLATVIGSLLAKAVR